MAENRVLFLCTGNYYRSRFAEEYFNHLARTAGADWTADSSGLDVAYGSTVNIGPISPYTIAALKARGIPFPRVWRMPKQVTESELQSARIIIALKEKEHRPMLQKLFPAYVDTVTYWHVHDLDAATPEEALLAIQSYVEDLFDTYCRLGGRCGSPLRMRS